MIIEYELKGFNETEFISLIYYGYVIISFLHRLMIKMRNIHFRVINSGILNVPRDTFKMALFLENE